MSIGSKLRLTSLQVNEATAVAFNTLAHVSHMFKSVD